MITIFFCIWVPSSSLVARRAGEDVVFVCNDWHTGLLACYLKSNYQSNGIYRAAKVLHLLLKLYILSAFICMHILLFILKQAYQFCGSFWPEFYIATSFHGQVAFCIHNISYQGRFSFDDFAQLNLPDRFKSSFDFIDGYDKPVEGRKINWMKAGILQADKVLTVSPYYAEELISGEARGCELDNIMRLTGITGIVNGMDVSEWDPTKDKFLAVNYDITTVSNHTKISSSSSGDRWFWVGSHERGKVTGVGGEGAEQGGAAGRGGAAGGPEGAPGGVHRQAGGAEGPRRDDRRHPGDPEGGGRPDRSPGTSSSPQPDRHC